MQITMPHFHCHATLLLVTLWIIHAPWIHLNFPSAPGNAPFLPVWLPGFPDPEGFQGCCSGVPELRNAPVQLSLTFTLGLASVTSAAPTAAAAASPADPADEPSTRQ